MSVVVFHGSGIVVSILARARWCVCVYVCVCVCVLGVGRVLGGMELTVGSNIMIFFFAYIAASHTAHVVYIFFI